MKHLYCFVDESGQDTRDGLFVVAAVATEDNVEHLRGSARKSSWKPASGRNGLRLAMSAGWRMLGASWPNQPCGAASTRLPTPIAATISI